jgi:hypothetical protein
VTHLLKHAPDSSRSFAAELRLIALPDFPQVVPGDDLAALTTEALARAGLGQGISHPEVDLRLPVWERIRLPVLRWNAK